jgi:hypothetical protein
VGWLVVHLVQDPQLPQQSEQRAKWRGARRKQSQPQLALALPSAQLPKIEGGGGGGSESQWEAAEVIYIFFKVIFNVSRLTAQGRTGQACSLGYGLLTVHASIPQCMPPEPNPRWGAIKSTRRLGFGFGLGRVRTEISASRCAQWQERASHWLMSHEATTPSCLRR